MTQSTKQLIAHLFLLMTVTLPLMYLIGSKLGEGIIEMHNAEHNKTMKEDQIVLEGCKNYKYQSTIYDNGKPWRYIYTCEDGKQVATKLLWVE